MKANWGNHIRPSIWRKSKRAPCGIAAYYARFDDEDIRKNIYGDKKSDRKGYRAKIDEGADGSIFWLVENAQYNGSKDEVGKNISAHTGVKRWDYFVKTVQINGVVYDLVANVRKKVGAEYVYSLQLRENTKIEAAAPATATKDGIQKGEATSDNSIPTSSEKSNRKIKASAVVRNDTVVPIEKRLRGDALLDAQDLIDTVMDVGGEVDGNGYITVYHRTNAENAANIRQTGVMTAKEDGLFFSTKETGYNDGYGDTVVKLHIPAEEMLLDDIFDDEVHLRIPLKRVGGKWQLNVSGYLADTENHDIRFSANGTAEVAALEAQNNALKEQIRQLNQEKAKLQKQVESKTAQVNKWKNKATFSPERVGKDIIRAYQSTVAEPEIHDDIESLIAYAGKAGSSISYGRMKEMAAGVAKKIVHHAETIVNGDVTQEYDAIRAYHRQVKLEVSPALKRDFADWGKWWQENGRKLHIVNSTKSNVDMIYAELREQFGEGYYPEDLINPADQMRRMAEVLDSLQPIVENPHSYNMAYAAEACANDLADMVMQEVSRGYAGTITYQLNEQLYRAKQEAREMAQRAIRAESAQRDDARAQIYAERLQRWETEEKRAARRKIAATVRTLDRALRNPTDSNHIPEELRGTVQELCSIFTHNRAEVLQQGEKITVDDHAIFDADKLEKARAYYAELKKTEEFGEVYDEETEGRLASLKGST